MGCSGFNENIYVLLFMNCFYPISSRVIILGTIIWVTCLHGTETYKTAYLSKKCLLYILRLFDFSDII